MNPTESVRPTDFGIVWRRGWIVVLCALIGAGAAYFHTRHEPKRFSATAGLLFGNNSVTDALGMGDASGASSQVGVLQATDQDLVGLPVILSRTRTALGTLPTGGFSVSTAASGSSNIVNVTVTARTPETAARVANIYAQQFVRYTLNRQQVAVRRAVTAIQRSIARRRKSAEAPAMQSTLAELQAILVSKPLDVSIAQLAAPPTASSGPRPSREGVLGLLIGIVVGIIFAIAVEALDPRLHSAKAVVDGHLEVLELGRRSAGPGGGRGIALNLVRRMRRQSAHADDAHRPLGLANGVVLSMNPRPDSILRERLTRAAAGVAAESGLSTVILRVDEEADPAAITPPDPSPDSAPAAEVLDQADEAGAEDHGDGDDEASAQEHGDSDDEASAQEHGDSDDEASAEDHDDSDDEARPQDHDDSDDEDKDEEAGDNHSAAGAVGDLTDFPEPLSASELEIHDLAHALERQPAHGRIAQVDVLAARARAFTDDEEMTRLLTALRGQYDFILIELASADAPSSEALIAGANAVVITARLHRSSRRGITRRIQTIRELHGDDPIVVTGVKRSLQALESVSDPRSQRKS